MLNKYVNYYFLILYCFIPISILIGPSVSLSNIIAIDLSFLILLIFYRDFSFLKSPIIKYFFILYLYLILSSFISLDPEMAANRNFGFIRIIILFVSFNYFFQKKIFFEKVLIFWLIVIFIVVLDVFIESVTGKNMLGYGHKEYVGRIVSFFKDEAIVGGYLNAFYLVLTGFFLDKFGSNKKNLIFVISLLIFAAIFMTGERSNGIKSVIGLSIFFLIYKDYNFKTKLIISFIGIFILIFSIFSSEYLKLRFVKQMKTYLSFNGNNYFYLYKSGYDVFKNNPIFGVGNKNYRVETCDSKKNYIEEKRKNYFCSTHPHQIYVELLSEHGLVGSFVILYLLYLIIFSKWKLIFTGNNYTQIGAYLYLILTFLPIIPSGAFFSDYSLTLFSINLSLLYAVNQKMNIFSNKV